jgi:hypothetical protein
VLVEGLNDPSGIDASGTVFNSTGTAGPAAATIDIDSNGTITGGSYHASADVGGCHRTADGDGAKGNVAAGATGSIVFTASHTNGGSTCRTETFSFDMAYQLGIVGDDLFLCRSPMATSSTCAAPYPRLVGQFHRT